MSEKRGHCCSECLLPSKGHGRPQGKACWRLAQVFSKVEQEEQDTTIEICKGCGRRGDGLGPVMPQIVCTTCGDSYHWLCAAVNKDLCGTKWNCARCKVGDQKKENSEEYQRCKVGDQRKETCKNLDHDFLLSRSGQHGKGLGLSKGSLGRRDIGGEHGHEVKKIISQEPVCVEHGKVFKTFLSESGEGWYLIGGTGKWMPPNHGERTEAMEELPLNGESIEAMEEWLKKN